MIELDKSHLQVHLQCDTQYVYLPHNHIIGQIHHKLRTVEEKLKI